MRSVFYAFWARRSVFCAHSEHNWSSATSTRWLQLCKISFIDSLKPCSLYYLWFQPLIARAQSQCKVARAHPGVATPLITNVLRFCSTSFCLVFSYDRSSLTTLDTPLQSRTKAHSAQCTQYTTKVEGHGSLWGSKRRCTAHDINQLYHTGSINCSTLAHCEYKLVKTQVVSLGSNRVLELFPLLNHFFALFDFFI